MLAHIVLITWGYAAGELAATPATLWDLVVNYPGMLLAAAGTGACAWSSSPASRRRAASCATSRGTCCTSTPTSASGSRCRTSCGPARTSSPRPAARCSGGALWVAAAGAVLVWRVGAAAVAQRPLPAAGRPRSCRRADGVRVGVPDRPRPATGCRPRPGSSSPSASWPARAGPARHPYSLSAAPDGARAADHRQGRRRRQRRAAAPAPGHPGAGRGPLRAADRPSPHPAAGSR